MESFTPSAIALSTLFAAAVILTVSRSPTPDHQLRSVNRLVVVACAAHLIHFLEEAAFDLHVRLPEVFGRPSMPYSFFLTINIGVLVIWLVGALQRSPNPFVLTTFWFLGLASVFNLIAHPVLALQSGGYFPGVVTSPLVGAMGFILMRRLLQVTGGGIQSGIAG